MINFHQTSPSNEFTDAAPVQMEYKPFHMILEDYLNGEVSLPQTDKGSYEFAQESDVDFNSANIDNHHDIFNVAAGVDPVFPDAKVVDSPASQSSSPAAASADSAAPSGSEVHE